MYGGVEERGRYLQSNLLSWFSIILMEYECMWSKEGESEKDKTKVRKGKIEGQNGHYNTIYFFSLKNAD